MKLTKNLYLTLLSKFQIFVISNLILFAIQGAKANEMTLILNKFYIPQKNLVTTKDGSSLSLKIFRGVTVTRVSLKVC